MIFFLELEISGLTVQSIHQNVKKNSKLCAELLSGNDFEAVSVTFFCYDHGVKASEAVQEIGTYTKNMHFYSCHSPPLKTGDRTF